MENYEQLTLNLLGNHLTPKAKYERLQFLIAVSENYDRTKKTLEFDLEMLGFDNQERHLYAEQIYNILIGKTLTR